MRQNKTPRSLHPTRWLLALATLALLPGIAAAQSLDGAGELSASKQALSACEDIEAQADTPKVSGQAHYDTSGTIDDQAGWESAGSAYVNEVDMPDASGKADSATQAGPLSHALGAEAEAGDENRVKASTCSEADLPDVEEKANSLRAEAEAFASATVSAASAAAEATAEAAAQVAGEAADEAQSFFVEIYASAQASIQAHF